MVSQKRVLVCTGICNMSTFLVKKFNWIYYILEKINLPKAAIQLQCAANMVPDYSTIIQGVSGVSLIFWEWRTKIYKIYLLRLKINSQCWAWFTHLLPTSNALFEKSFTLFHVKTFITTCSLGRCSIQSTLDLEEKLWIKIRKCALLLDFVAFFFSLYWAHVLVF